ncbi:MAG: hypothetical protein ABSD71_13330 [Bacteroidales bacterium]|jgi:hypothetical protein
MALAKREESRAAAENKVNQAIVSEKKPPTARKNKEIKMQVGLVKDDYKTFQNYCDSIGVSISSKAREIILEYMVKKGIK